jgi:nucleoside-diphosphate-sugar epimerase
VRSEILDGLLGGLDDALFEPFLGKTVVVTGATGLIGSLVCKALLLADERMGLGCKVTAVVRSREKADAVLGDYATLGSLNYVIADLMSGEPVENRRADYVLHAASVTKSKVMVERPVDVIETSLRGTETMLEFSRAADARMVYVSSMEVYGDLPRGVVADENELGWLDLSSSRTSYPESKRMCECLCNAYASQRGVEVCSARLAQTFGAGVLSGEGRAFMQFARAAMRGEDVVLKTRGLSEGNYVNSVDCVTGLLMLLASGTAGQAYNVANEESHGTIREVAQLACDVLGDGRSNVVIDVDESNSAGYAPDVHLRLSSAKLRALGWVPGVPLADSFRQIGFYINEQGLLWKGSVF